MESTSTIEVLDQRILARTIELRELTLNIPTAI